MECVIVWLLSVLLICLWFYRKRKAPSITLKQQCLKGKVVLITGASSGLGKACCFAFHKYGCKVILCSRTLEELEKVKLELDEKFIPKPVEKKPSIVFQLDVTDIDHVGNTIRKITAVCDSKIDILINNAGLDQRGSALASNLDVYRRIFDVNLFGQITVTKAVLPYMVAQRSGHIVGIGSVQSKISVPFRTAYSASKHASQGFYDALRPEVHEHNIHVTTVNPGYIKTNISMNALNGDGSVYGKLDGNQKNGMEADFVAEEIVNSVVKKENDVMIAPFLHKIAVWIRFLSPNLYFWIMRKRAGL
uniref:Dehydrogenase/reductase SDR family member 7B n=1 Tax=Phallusia mammillata TaxID=59560 RepID=A0A6F9DAC7_9ASCI|nr:dehydrogenase/reductase SDR family protein 7-like [Phallusia mammillata]